MASLTSGQRSFAQHLARLTGLNSRAISAWMLAEESGGAAQARQRQGNNNWLNIGYFDSGPGAITKDQAFRNPVRAAQYTAAFLKGQKGGAAPGIRAILRTANQGPEQQLRAIAASPWASSHYGGPGRLISLLGSAPAPGAAPAGPSGSSGRSRGGRVRTIPGRPGSTRTESTTTIIPGVDNRLARASLIQSFLDSHSSIDPLDFAVQARQLQDVAPSSTTETQTFRTPGTPSRSVHVPGHGRISPQGAGASFAKSHSPLLELIHKGDRPYAVKNGKRVNGPQFYSSVWDGHADHVHVAAGPKTVVELGQLARRMGLQVGENPHFGTVHRVHAPNSYHYKGEAIDVSGDPRKMNQFARKVEQLYGLNR